MQTPAPTNIASSLDSGFLRLPKPRARCPVSNLSRTTLVELIAEGRIKAKRLRRRGNVRGIVLILRESLVDYLNSLPDVQAK